MTTGSTIWPFSQKLEKRISCEKCGAVFDTKKARQEHINAAHPFAGKTFHLTCTVCLFGVLLARHDPDRENCDLDLDQI